ncbi:hypothetical protein [Neisseria wadsworthii]|uniref:Uncharacterized protein n=1 Tax=Neisseria wadsworthii 9715 TaxID=1030841 RepID=G4CSZ2_9NEIS|nr:hypothetical protein [Neisseria wadsworthii]EGZ44489.1 hypothetical protein HMPREF9370_2202 [Neisseria wadsworthii 9715]
MTVLLLCKLVGYNDMNACLKAFSDRHRLWGVLESDLPVAQ